MDPKRCCWNSVLVQRVKYPALSLQWLGTLLWGTGSMCVGIAKKKKKKKKKKRDITVIYVQECSVLFSSKSFKVSGLKFGYLNYFELFLSMVLGNILILFFYIWLSSVFSSTY